jgi:hypothetical protein
MSNPTISDAKRLSVTHTLRRCVILFELDDGRVGYSSYGRTRALCRGTQEVMDEAFDDLERRIRRESAK